MSKLISFRANDEDMNIIELYRRKQSDGVRKVTDADVLRYGLSLIGVEKKIIKKIPSDVIQEEVSEDDMNNGLSKEQVDAGYQYVNGELLDKDGFPVEEMNGDVVTRGGQAYVTDPNREELREKGAEKMSEIVIDTPMGAMNETMAAVLGEKHSAPGMLTQQDGVDEQLEDNFNQE